MAGSHCEAGAKDYEFDVNIDADYYQQWYTEKLLPVIKEKMPRLDSRGGLYSRRA